MATVKRNDAKSVSDMIDNKVSMTNTDSGGANMEPIKVDSPYIPEIDACVMDERHRNLMKTKMIISSLFRRFYNITFANKWGHFTDYAMTQIIHKYGYWVSYQKGNGQIDVGCDDIVSMVLSKDEHYLYTGDSHGKITQFSLINDTEIKQWSTNKFPVRCLASFNGYLISTSSDCLIHIWSPMNHRILAGYCGFVMSLDVSLDGKMIVSGSRDGCVRVWSFNTGLLLKEWKCHYKSVRSVLFMGNSIISGSEDFSMKVFTDVERAKLCMAPQRIKSITCNSRFIACRLFSAISIIKWPELTEIRRMENRVKCLAFHPLKDHILAMAHRWDHSVFILDVMSGNMSELCRIDSYSTTIGFTYNGDRLVIATSNCIKFIDLSLLSIDYDGMRNEMRIGDDTAQDLAVRLSRSRRVSLKLVVL